MKVDRDVVVAVADLAMIHIDERELAEVSDSLARILDLVDELANVDTEGVPPLAHPLDAVQRLRADTVTEVDQRALFQSVAPETEDGLYLVPRVIE